MILNDSEEQPPGDDATDSSNNKTQKKKLQHRRSTLQLSSTVILENNQARSTHNMLSMLEVEARTSLLWWKWKHLAYHIPENDCFYVSGDLESKLSIK